MASLVLAKVPSQLWSHAWHTRRELRAPSWWSGLRHDQNNGCQHAPTPSALWWRRNPLGHEACACLEVGTRVGECVGVKAPERAQWSNRRADLRLQTTFLLLLLLRHPVSGLQRGQTHVGVWRKQLWPTAPWPTGFGCKTEYGTVTPDVFGQLLQWRRPGPVPLQVLSSKCGRSASLSWRQRSLKKKKKREGEARKEANIPLKCTDNWNPMGCSQSACCDGGVVGPSLPCQRGRKQKKRPCCACGPFWTSGVTINHGDNWKNTQGSI